MEDFPIILIAIILGIVSSVSKNKKKQAEAAKRQLSAEKGAGDAWKTAPQQGKVTVAPTPKPVAKKPVVVAKPVIQEVPRVQEVFSPAAPKMGVEGEDACHDYMLPEKKKQPVRKTLENHAPAAPVMGTEGKDVCHQYMLDEPAKIQTENLDAGGMTQAEAKALVQGIIFSEIMARPNQRFAGRKR